jgi:hypothetical protein
MPFQSEAQRKYLWIHEPTLAKKWSREYGSAPIRSKIQRAAWSRLKKLGKK